LVYREGEEEPEKEGGKRIGGGEGGGRMSSLKKTRKTKKRRSTYFFSGRTHKNITSCISFVLLTQKSKKHKSFPFAVTSTIRMNPL
jgi:hypothetical protein